MPSNDAAPVPDSRPAVAQSDAELVFGLGRGLHHAVTRRAAEHAGGRLARGSVAGAVCGEIVQVATSWGAYERGSIYLQHGHVCGPCSWIVATSNGQLPDLIDSIRPAAQHLNVITGALGDPLAGVRLLEAIAADDELGDDLDDLAGEFTRSRRADLLAHAAAHLPAVVVCEDCAEGGASVHGDDEPCTAALCLTCTVKSGPWAGEWEGYTLDECVVPSPCSVLRALCEHYKIALP